MAAERKPALSWLNVIFCAMVLNIHCASHAVTHLRAESWQFALIFLVQRLCFVSVPGFFVLSGVKLMLPRAHALSTGTYYRGRFRSIFLPYLVSMCVYYLWFSAALHYFEPQPGDFLVQLCTGRLVAPFYFVVALVQFILLMPLLRRITKYVSPALSLPLALAVTLLCAQTNAVLQLFDPALRFDDANRLFTRWLFYYLAGCYIGRQYDGFLTALQKRRGSIAVALVLTAATDLALVYRERVLGHSSGLLPLAHEAYLMAGIAFCFLLAPRLCRPLPRFLQRVDRASYLIFLYHPLALSATEQLLGQRGVTDAAITYALRLIAAFAVTPLVCVGWQTLVNAARQKFLAKT